MSHTARARQRKNHGARADDDDTQSKPHHGVHIAGPRHLCVGVDRPIVTRDDDHMDSHVTWHDGATARPRLATDDDDDDDDDVCDANRGEAAAAPRDDDDDACGD